MEVAKGHPCYGCTAVAVDHAIVCPLLGVIASGKHRRMQSHSASAAYNLLDNSHSNRRQVIQLKAPYWETQTYGKLIPLSADKDGTLIYGAKRRVEASPRSEKATRAPRRNRATRNAELQIRVSQLFADKLHRAGGTTADAPQSDTLRRTHRVTGAQRNTESKPPSSESTDPHGERR